MRCSSLCFAAALLAFSTTAGATPFTFDTDPFAGSTAPTDPGRQVVGGEPFITFSIATDKFVFDPAVFGIGPVITLANDVIENVPTTGVNAVVLRSFDNDGDPGTPFNAGTAATLIANRITTPGPGFFIYFNQGLDLPRLVFSADLDSSDADLKILARLTNLTGQGGRDAMATFSDANFDVLVPEPSGVLLLSSAGAIWVLRGVVRRRRRN
jgi:hypothetical protein